MIEKAYQPNEVEDRIYRAWEAAHAFDSGRPERTKAEPYCIVIPPPNVTGSLHMGHALNNTLQDILCRFERMRGKDVLWQVGTDHAGIATQMVVERQLMENQEHRRQLGREEFVKRVWKWKEESGGTIIRQLKKLGASCDWRRERFTMDEGLSRAVLKVFVDLYKEGLIYKDKRLVNWDPKLLTAISDLEVQQVETKGHLWHLKYPIEGTDQFIVVATTRPETMLGDVAVAVHPDSERWKRFIGKHAILPLVGRKIPIIADEYADPEKGSGAVKITPAHDFNDFEVGKRHNLPQVSVLDVEGKLSLNGNKAFAASAPASPELTETMQLHGVDRFKARKIIVERLEAAGLMDKIEPHTHTVPHGDRSNVVIEPYLTDQWYVDAKKLAEPAIAAVRERKTVFIPPNWEKTYFDWMENIQPWCISRQLWWGHQIPVWYGPTVDEQGFAVEVPYKEFVGETEQAALAEAKLYYGPNVKVAVDRNPVFQASIDSLGRRKVEQVGVGRDSDVLDTWFSSALWPFSTLGWPDETKELKRFYPTTALVTGFDIIFFWVARMMMMGLHFMKEVPFRDVYIHALVRDERGAKMSKSKGNVIDPLSIIDDYGADALRFTLAAMAAQGRDIKLSSNRVEGYRNFATKLWNAARFAEINGCVRDAKFNSSHVKETYNRWILMRLGDAIAQVEIALHDYRFNDAANHIYHFVWNSYCDWYLELVKPILQGEDGPVKAEVRSTTAFVLDEILKLLHPFMPFITEELWRVTGESGPKREKMLALAEWPERVDTVGDATEAVNWLIELVTKIRSVRAELNVPSANQIPLVVVGKSELIRSWLITHQAAIERLARLSSIAIADVPPKDSVHIDTADASAWLPLKGVVDFAAELARLEKELGKIAADVAHIDKKLGNADFMARAPEEVVDEQREKREEAEGRAAKVREALERLKGAA